LGDGAAATECIGLVEEDDHAAVAHRKLAQLPEERLDLEDADAHEHLDESAGVDEHERPSGLACYRFGDKRLAGARRAPQQDASGDIAAALLNRLGILEEDHVLLDLGEHVVLAPDIGEPGLDVVGKVDVYAAAREEPEQPDELKDDDEEVEDELDCKRQRLKGEDR
jgi:hypothetical protein